jgi:hypothetical protein
MAIVLEERAGFLGARRKRELAGRHLTVNNMRDGATFADATGALLARGFSAEEAVRTAERVYRGADGRSHGLGRERVYLESFVRARKHLSRRPQDGVVVSSGQISLDAARTLLPFVGTDSSRGPTAPGSSR